VKSATYRSFILLFLLHYILPEASSGGMSRVPGVPTNVVLHLGWEAKIFVIIFFLEIIVLG